MGQSPISGTQTTHIFANAGAYSTTGIATTTVATALSNREQENTIGSDIGNTTIDLTFRGASASGSYQIAVWKRERQNSVPVAGTGLPSNANIISFGLQSAMRTEMPGRVLYFDTIGVATGQPRSKKILINWKKFRLGKMRQGDFYGITIFNNGTTDGDIDIQTRYKEYV